MSLVRIRFSNSIDPPFAFPSFFPSSTAATNYQTLDGHRSRTYSESRGHVSAEIDGLLDDLNRMRHRESLSNRTGMTRWSSLGTVRADGGRYSTTLTRRHLKRGREPVDVYLKKPVSKVVPSLGRAFYYSSQFGRANDR